MKSKKKGSKEPSAKEITKAGPGIKSCSICHKPRVNPKDKSELEQHGKFYQLDKNHFFHFFCLLFSNGAKQLGEDQEGINGFLRSDILNVLDNSLNNKCYICDKNHATSKCHQCSKKFHFTCGSAKEATFVFEASLGNKSFCHLHSPKSRHKLLHDRTCMAGKNTLLKIVLHFPSKNYAFYRLSRDSTKRRKVIHLTMLRKNLSYCVCTSHGQFLREFAFQMSHV